MAEDSVEGLAVVRLHVYDLDPLTGWLCNKADGWPRARGLSIFHCGVEVYGWEYSFAYYYDAWEADALTGVQQHRPRQNPMFAYRESVELGGTPLARGEVRAILKDLREAWPANGYHLIARNCVNFADELVGRLQAREVPAWVGGLGRTAFGVVPLRCAVNALWRLFVWAMVLTSREMELPEDFCVARELFPASPSARGAARGAVAWQQRLLRCSALAPALPCALLLAVPLPGAAPRPLPLGALLSLAAASVCVVRHWNVFQPLRWLERGALLAFAAWAALRAILLHGAWWPLWSAVAVSLCLCWRWPSDPASSASGGAGRLTALVAAHALAATAGMQLIWAEKAAGSVLRGGMAEGHR